jgi:hypothetical protein
MRNALSNKKKQKVASRESKHNTVLPEKIGWKILKVKGGEETLHLKRSELNLFAGNCHLSKKGNEKCKLLESAGL